MSISLSYKIYLFINFCIYLISNYFKKLVIKENALLVRKILMLVWFPVILLVLNVIVLDNVLNALLENISIISQGFVKIVTLSVKFVIKMIKTNVFNAKFPIMPTDLKILKITVIVLKDSMKINLQNYAKNAF